MNYMRIAFILYQAHLKSTMTITTSLQDSLLPSMSFDRMPFAETKKYTRIQQNMDYYNMWLCIRGVKWAGFGGFGVGIIGLGI